MGKTCELYNFEIYDLIIIPNINIFNRLCTSEYKTKLFIGSVLRLVVCSVIMIYLNKTQFGKYDNYINYLKKFGMFYLILNIIYIIFIMTKQPFYQKTEDKKPQKVLLKM